MLPGNARKELQIAAINRHEELLILLVMFASGDESATLDAMVKLLSPHELVTAKPVTEKATELPPAPSNLVSFPTPVTINVCECKMAVKDKMSATHLCVVCGKNAYSNYFVHADTPEGKALIAGEEPVIENWHEPVGPPADSTPQTTTAASIEATGFTIPLPPVFETTSYDEYGEETA